MSAGVTAADTAVKSFNSLFEMRLAMEANSADLDKPFNSLFEMPGPATGAAHRRDQLSILYLRCEESGKLYVWRKISVLSILYLRCFM